MPIGKHWKRKETADRWAEKIAKHHREQGMESVIKRVGFEDE